MKKNKSYTLEFKKQAVALADSLGSTSKAAEQLDISDANIYCWRKASSSAVIGNDERNLRAELAQLKRENAKPKKVNYILKGAAAFFSQVAMRNEGFSCGKTRILSFMKLARISGPAKQRFKAVTTDSRYAHPIAEKLFKTEELATHPTAPNQVWASDISYIPTGEGFLYLATYLNLFTPKLVGFSTADHMRAELIETALDMALGRQQLVNGTLVNHSDRGSQYASETYRTKLSRHFA